jgi:hypothetical protein
MPQAVCNVLLEQNWLTFGYLLVYKQSEHDSSDLTRHA